jgi:hypothetical protein
MPDRNAAPRIELVAPEAKLMIGSASAAPASMTVPSFCVKKRGATIPLIATAAVKPATVFRAKSVSAALRRAAFSRSRSPIRPSRCEQVTTASGHSASRIARALSSQLRSSGEKIAAIATEWILFSRIRRAAHRMPASSNGIIGRPS